MRKLHNEPPLKPHSRVQSPYAFNRAFEAKVRVRAKSLGLKLSKRGDNYSLTEMFDTDLIVTGYVGNQPMMQRKALVTGTLDEVKRLLDSIHAHN